MADYELITLAGLGLAYVVSSVYLEQREKKIINDFGNWVNDSFKSQAEELQETINEFKDASKVFTDKMIKSNKKDLEELTE